jgi:hypothetical protein
MTNEEMNEFLQSIDGLENGFYTDTPPITDSNFFDVDNGWYLLIKELIEDLITLGWDKQTCQVKEKFGGLRFYINSGSDEIFARISKAENDSYEICEKCGEKGELRRDIGWYTTLCDVHYQERKVERNK